MKIYRGYLLLVVFYVLAYIVPLGMRPMIAPDEFRYAEIPAGMIASNDYVVPRLIGIRYFEKPALGYQITAGFFRIFGENAFSLRLMSALAAGFTAFLLVLLIRKRSEDHELAALAGGIYLTSGLVYGIGTFAVLDSLFTAMVAGTMISFFFAYVDKAAWRKAALLLLCGVFCGLAFLSKGFLAFVLPAIIVTPFLLWERKFKDFFVLPWLPMLGAAATIAPWAIAVHLREPDYWNYFFWIEHIQRFTQEVGGQHPEPWYYFIPVLFAGALPAGVLLPVALRGLKGGAAEIFKLPRYRFALCYFLMPFIFFSSSSGKLGTYILPCFLPWAMLLAVGVIRYVRSAEGRGFHRAGAVFGIFLMTAAVAAPFVCRRLPEWGGPQFAVYADDEWYKCLLCALFIFVWGAATFFTRKCVWQRQLAGTMLGMLPMLLTGPALTPSLVLEGKAQEIELKKLFAETGITPQTVLFTFDNTMHAAGWLARHPERICVFGYPGEVSYGVTKYPDARFKNIQPEGIQWILRQPAYARFAIIGRYSGGQLPWELRDLPEPDRKGRTGKLFIHLWEAKSK